MTTVAAKSPSKAIDTAANSGTGAATDTCINCLKKGLAILPVVNAVLPNAIKQELSGLDQGYKSVDLGEHWYFLRSLPAGYLYVLKSDTGGNAPALGGWDAYVVDVEGLLRKVAPGDQPAAPADVKPMAQACRRKGDNIPAQVIAVDIKRHPKVWMAFSRFRWTAQVLSRYAANTENCRTQRMVEVDTSAAAAGQIGEGSKVPNGTNMGPHIARWVADYAATGIQTAVNRQTEEPIANRAEQLAALQQAMTKISEHTPSKTGVVIALDDVVGVTAALNLRRSRMTAEAAASMGIGDAEKSRRRVIADVIEGIRLSAEKNPGPWWDKNYGPDRFMKHIDQGAWQKAREETAQFKTINAQIEKISADYVAVKESDAWKAQQRFDFDADNDRSACDDHSGMVVMCVAGSGLTKIEREKVWWPALQATVAAPDNWLDRALVALHPDALSYIQQDNKQDKSYDMVKGAAAISKNLTEEGAKALSRLRDAIKIRRAANQSTAVLIESTTALLYRLYQTNPQAHYKLMRKVAVALLVRDGQVAQPKVVHGTYEKIAQWISEIAMGKPRTALPIKLRGDIANVDSYKSVKGNFGEEGWRMSQAMEGAVVFEQPKTRTQQGDVVAWVVTKLGEGAVLDEKTLKRLGLEHIDLNKPLPTSTTNPFLEAALKRTSQRADVVLGAGVLFFQTNSFISALSDFRTKTGGMDRAGGGVGMTTAVLSATAASAEVYVAVKLLSGAPKSSLMRPQVLAAKLSFWAGAIEGLYLFAKGVDKTTSGDKDSGLWVMASGVAVAVGGVASSAAGMAVVAGMAGGVAEATAMGLTLGPVGWGLIAIAFIAAAIYFSWQAFATDDQNLLPVEYWLDAGVFGKRQFISGEAGQKSPFYNAALKSVPAFKETGEEIMALQRITLVAQARINGARDSSGYSLLSHYEVTVPRYVEGSRVEITFIAIQNGKRRDGGGVVCEDGKVNVAKNTISNKFTGMREAPKIEYDAETGVMRVKGYFATMQAEPWSEKAVEWVMGKDTNPDALYADHVEMQVKYWPDRMNLPQLLSEIKGSN